MEQLNKIEIRGIVGSVYVKDFTNAKVANISVATNYTYNAKVVICVLNGLAVFGQEH